MPKGYLIGHVTITDAEAYAVYAEAAGAAMAKFDSTMIAASGRYDNLEGEAHERHVIFEFASFDDAKRFYESPEYQAAKALRAEAATGTFVLLEGAA
ncbi:DUF1330 domain-containing protein [Salinicola rhizosphaerae]|uniref:DUF1330 domain-containing protein n=1 Tax=Salinicola rhizosphaerae TaxID=1443141 RepID=A0ABQ3DWI9_9GAMM|nr:DUF1330 domain-containing protein [Salinicola rhizosphaerae]GHB17555.1 hypothetical protein GCM10009038_15450 [Salinicola rhizosphaerae]